MDTTRPTISAPHEQPKPDIVYMSELGRTGQVANGVARRWTNGTHDVLGDRRDRRPQHVLHGTAHDGAPYSSRVAIIIRVGPDGLITRVDEYVDPAALDPLQKQEPSGGDMSTVTELLNNPESVGVWTLDPDRSTIRFNNKTMWGAMKVNGVFTEFSGDGQITDTGTLFGRIDIKAASLNTKLLKRDEDLRSPTFLDVEKYPDISVVVTGAEPGRGETLKLRADLTVKGTTAPMPMQANLT